MKTLSVFVFALLISTFSLACMSVGSLVDAKEKEEFHKTYDLVDTGVISLNNVNGAVNIRVWDEQRVELKAIKAGPSKEVLDSIKIEIDSKPDRLKIETVYPNAIQNINASVSYELTVPKNASLNKIETVNGSVEITGVQGKVDVETTNGSITINGGQAEMESKTVNGSIKASLPQVPSSGRVKMETVNGSLSLSLPETLNADLEAETTNGRINSDFALPAEDGNEKKHLKGKIGSGGPQVSLETVNGSVTITRIKS